MPLNADYSITFACLNQLDYTQKFVSSLIESDVDLDRVVAVDNHSSDSTISWLKSLGIETIANKKNLGCGTAWNQGILSRQSEWTIVMNNDVICHPDWLPSLLDGARMFDLKIASPSMIEGFYGDDFKDLSNQWSQRMLKHVRINTAHAVCMAIHQSVWDQIGYFMPVPRLLGYEDGIFFQRAKENNIPMGILGSSWIHHFGMTTQKAMKMEQKLNESDSLGDRSLLRLYMNVNRIQRQLSRWQRKKDQKKMANKEFQLFGATVHGIRSEDKISWL